MTMISSDRESSVVLLCDSDFFLYRVAGSALLQIILKRGSQCLLEEAMAKKIDMGKFIV